MPTIPDANDDDAALCSSSLSLRKVVMWRSTATLSIISLRFSMLYSFRRSVSMMSEILREMLSSIIIDDDELV